MEIQAQDAMYADRNEKWEARKARHAKKISLKALKGETVNEATRQRFEADFQPATDVVWQRTAHFDEVAFTNGEGKKLKAYYDGDGQLVGTTRAASFSELPPAAQQEIARHHTDYANAPVIFFDDNETNDTDMILYGAQFDDADNYFVELKDKRGRPIVLQVNKQGEVAFFANIPQAR
ncbi:DUF1838 domain-containing protein [Chitinophaga nivalis]|uniref:DUF1838 domain-containing protein n=1 Tax=Chitinophaga nivalis TaxID=2991709 RepID=A0ABT3ILX6_9BACT|nr:DUF1838 domain-containing protein [Chitinophaga nivalis]MCW3465347.1 DUF1838 domain-containing protein [Chitinophaga nivalis]MCW3484961.1 DUF1838 domain-containing protein [Chitinophaga nivalis]